METSDWLLVVASVVLGQFALLAIEVLRGQLERWQRRQDRRDDFQRNTLLELQEALYQVTEWLSNARSRRQSIYEKSGAWGTVVVSDEHVQVLNSAMRRLEQLKVLVDDADLRLHASRFESGVIDTLRATDPEDWDKRWSQANSHLHSANRRLGHLVRKL